MAPEVHTGVGRILVPGTFVIRFGTRTGVGKPLARNSFVEDRISRLGTEIDIALALHIMGTDHIDHTCLALAHDIVPEVVQVLFVEVPMALDI